MEYIIDLQSFHLEAESEEEAREKAIQELKNGEARIDQILEA